MADNYIQVLSEAESTNISLTGYVFAFMQPASHEEPEEEEQDEYSDENQPGYSLEDTNELELDRHGSY